MRKADNLPPSCAVVTKYGNLNFLEPSGPIQACNGTALPFFITFISVFMFPRFITIYHVILLLRVSCCVDPGSQVLASAILSPQNV